MYPCNPPLVPGISWAEILEKKVTLLMGEMPFEELGNNMLNYNVTSCFIMDTDHH